MTTAARFTGHEGVSRLAPRASLPAVPATEPAPQPLGGASLRRPTMSGEDRARRPGISWRQVLGLRSAGVVYALVLLVIFLSVASASMGRQPYLSELNVGNLLEQSSLVGIMAIGMAILLISGSFDLSVGSLAALCALLAAFLTNEIGVGPALGLTILAGVAGGLLNGCIHHLIGINSFIVTLGTLTAFRGLGLMLSDGRTIIIDDPDKAAALEAITASHLKSPNLVLVLAILVLTVGAILLARRHPRSLSLAVIGAGVLLLGASFYGSFAPVLALSTLYWLALGAAAWFFTRFTVFGTHLYAVGGRINAARVAGIPIHIYKVIPFGIVGACAGLAGVLLAGRLGAVDPNSFTGAELTVIAAAVVGGVSILGGSGNILKVIVGTTLLFTIANGFNMLNMNAHFQLVFAGVVVIAAAGLYTITDRRRAR